MDPVYGITKYDKSHYNGVLFLMREAHKADNSEKQSAIDKGNKDWLERVIHYHYNHHTPLDVKDNPTAISRYGNRFAEILEQLPVEDNNLESIAYANINPAGGGKTKGKEYNDRLKQLDKRIADIFSVISEEDTQFIILCRDAFDMLLSPSKIQEGPGLKYRNNKIGRAGKKTDGHIIYLEMIKHPCISPTLEKNVRIDLDWTEKPSGE